MITDDFILFGLNELRLVIETHLVDAVKFIAVTININACSNCANKQGCVKLYLYSNMQLWVVFQEHSYSLCLGIITYT